MTFILLDPNLVDENGHHLAWDFAIAAAAARAGHRPVIYANRRFSTGAIEGVRVVPQFTHTTYETRSADPLSGAFDDFEFFNQHLLAELASLSPAISNRDVVVVPTTSENHLLGYVRWMKSFPVSLAPKFIVHLMFPSGLDFEEGKIRIRQPVRALCYRLTFREAADCESQVIFFGAGRQLAAEFSEIAGMHIQPFAIPLAPARGLNAGASGDQTALLFAGDAKAEKGFLHLPQLAAELCRRHPDWHFMVHANAGLGGARVHEAFAALETLAAEQPNFTLRGGRLTEQQYQMLLEDADCWIATYDPAVYSAKSSGIVWECISLGIPLLVPSGTWLEREAQLWRAGYQTYSAATPRGIAEAFENVSGRLEELKEKSAAASREFQRTNGADTLVEQIMAGRVLSNSIENANTSSSSRRSQWKVGEAFTGRFGDVLIRVGDAKLVQHSSGERFRYLDIVLIRVTAGPESWSRLKFKLVSTRDGLTLEFRKGAGWPEMFRAWPSEETDKFGDVLRLPDNNELSEIVSAWDRRDRNLLGIISALLPLVVPLVLSHADIPDDERESWRRDSASFSERLAAAIGETHGQLLQAV